MANVTENQKTPVASAPASGSVRTCEMERISRAGKCGKPTSGYWIHDDGTKTAVCDMCALSVMVNGGKLEQALNGKISEDAGRKE